MPKFVTDGASLSCPMGTAKATLKVIPSSVKGCGNPMANILDAAPMCNIPSFGTCSITMAPCVPATACWISSSNVQIRGAPAVDDSCKAICALGGMISVSAPGQSTSNKA